MTGSSKKPDFLSLLGRINRILETEEPPKKPKPKPKLLHQEETTCQPTVGDAPPLPENSVEKKSHRKNGMPDIQFKRLLRGKFPIRIEIDLHGLSREAAWNHLNETLEKSQGERLRCARIIHGKGLHSSNASAVLRPLVRNWLRQDQRVLAYSEPSEKHGGSGAVLILLRAKRPAQ